MFAVLMVVVVLVLFKMESLASLLNYLPTTILLDFETCLYVCANKLRDKKGQGKLGESRRISGMLIRRGSSPTRAGVLSKNFRCENTR